MLKSMQFPQHQNEKHEGAFCPFNAVPDPAIVKVIRWEICSKHR